MTRANVGLQASGLLYTNQAEAGAATEGAEPDEQEQTSTGAAEWATAEPEEERWARSARWVSRRG